MYVTKKEMVADLCRQLVAAGYGVTMQAISKAYPAKRGSRLLWGVWQRHRRAIHWAADKLIQKGVVFTKRPELMPEAPPPIPRLRSTLPLWGADRQLPPGDRD